MSDYTTPGQPPGAPWQGQPAQPPYPPQPYPPQQPYPAPGAPWQGQMPQQGQPRPSYPPSYPSPQQAAAPWPAQPTQPSAQWPGPAQPTAQWPGQHGPGSSPLTPAAPDYTAESAERARRASRDIGFGWAWLGGGALLTLITYTSDSPVYVVAWGPMLYGAYLLFRGYRARSRG